MVFRGTLTDDMRAMVHEVARHDWVGTDIYAPFSGNMTIPKVVKNIAGSLHACDVTLYSCAIGKYLEGAEVEYWLRPDREHDWGWISAHMGDRRERMALLLLAQDMMVGADRDRPNPHYARIQNAYMTQWDNIWPRTLEKVDKMGDLQLDSFFVGDAMKWMEQIPDEAVFVGYPPFYRGGYEVMFNGMMSVLDWHEPEYDLFDPSVSIPLLMQQVQRFNHWMIITDVRLPEWDEYQIMQTRPTSRQSTVYAYCNSNSIKRTRQPDSDVRPVRVPLADLDLEITSESEISLIQLDYQELGYLQSIFMDRNINAASTGGTQIGIVVDGKLIGACAFRTRGAANEARNNRARHELYMLCDFALSGSAYPRLSKLVLYAILSQEARLLLQRLVNHYIEGFFTTAISDHPVSMKYRGLFRLHSRKDYTKDTNEAESHPAKYRLKYRPNHKAAASQAKYRLNYEAAAGQWSLVEGLATWCRKHGKRAD